MYEDINLLSRVLDAKLLRHEVLSNNIANVDTPNFKRSDVSFEKELKEALTRKKSIPLKTTNMLHIQKLQDIRNVKPRTYIQDDRGFRNDQNNVDIDKEMTELVKNTISYNIISDQIQRNLKMLQLAISEGRK